MKFLGTWHNNESFLGGKTFSPVLSPYFSLWKNGAPHIVQWDTQKTKQLFSHSLPSLAVNAYSYLLLLLIISRDASGEIIYFFLLYAAEESGKSRAVIDGGYRSLRPNERREDAKLGNCDERGVFASSADAWLHCHCMCLAVCVWKWRWGDKKRVWKEEEEKMVLEFSPSPLEGASRRVVTFYAHLLLQGASAQGGGGGILLTASWASPCPFWLPTLVSPHQNTTFAKNMLWELY